MFVSQTNTTSTVFSLLYALISGYRLCAIGSYINNALIIVQVKRKLPDWLLHPDCVDADIANEKKPVSAFGDLLSEHVKRKLAEQEVTHLFPGRLIVTPFIIHTGIVCL